MAWKCLLLQEALRIQISFVYGQVELSRDHCYLLVHPGIRQLQLILLKVALILGIEIHVNVEFQGLVQPPEDQENERELD